MPERAVTLTVNSEGVSTHVQVAFYYELVDVRTGDEQGSQTCMKKTNISDIDDNNKMILIVNKIIILLISVTNNNNNNYTLKKY